MNKSDLEQLAQNHPTASWAIWSDKFPRIDSLEASDDKRQFIEFVKNHSGDLKPEIVLVGLNPSTEKPGLYSNFHSTKARHQDAWLRVFVEESGLEGAFMTDISEDVRRRDKDVSLEDEPINEFTKQLNLLGKHSFDIICWGRKAYDYLKQYSTESESELRHDIFHIRVEIGEKVANLYSVYHYSQVNPDNLEVLRKQLDLLNFGSK